MLQKLVFYLKIIALIGFEDEALQFFAFLHFPRKNGENKDTLIRTHTRMKEAMSQPIVDLGRNRRPDQSLTFIQSKNILS